MTVVCECDGTKTIYQKGAIDKILPNCTKLILNGEEKPLTDAQKYKIIPLFKIENVLTVAMADPLDLFAIDKIIETAECSIEPVIASETSIAKKIDEYYKVADTVDNITLANGIENYDWTDELHDTVPQSIKTSGLTQSILL